MHCLRAISHHMLSNFNTLLPGHELIRFNKISCYIIYKYSQKSYSKTAAYTVSRNLIGYLFCLHNFAMHCTITLMNKVCYTFAMHCIRTLMINSTKDLETKCKLRYREKHFHGILSTNVFP